MMVEISDTIVEAITKHTAFKLGVPGIKFEVNAILWRWLVDHLPYDGYSELHELNLDDVIG